MHKLNSISQKFARLRPHSYKEPSKNIHGFLTVIICFIIRNESFNPSARKNIQEKSTSKKVPKVCSIL